MMTFRTFTELLQEHIQDTAVNDEVPLKGMPPALLTMARQSIRQFPNGNTVALYYSKQIGRYFTIVYH
jgi:hypothetical protein